MPRVVLGICALIAAGCAAAAASEDSNLQSGLARCAAAVGCAPSKFDYLVLASMADSPHFLVFRGYRPTAHKRIAGGISLKSTNPPDDKGK